MTWSRVANLVTSTLCVQVTRDPYGGEFVPRLSPSLTAAAAILIGLAIGGEPARGQGPWYEGFEGPQTSWSSAGGDARFEILSHQRVGDEAFTGDGSEKLVVSGTGGSQVHVSHDIGRPRVIDELSPSVRVKSDRAGLQILAQVVLTRTNDPRTGRPASVLVQGSSYTAVGRWQQLRIEGIPDQLERRARVLRAELGAGVDPREAYVERILLNVYGGPGVTNVWIDDLDVGGFVAAHPGTPDWAAAGSAAEPSRPVALPKVESHLGGSTPRSPDSLQRQVSLEGSVLLANGEPLFPRMIEYQGEPLPLLKRLGFNAVWFAEPPSFEILDEASRQGLWLVCPPPHPFQSAGQARPTALHPIGPRYDSVLAWDLGQGLSTGEQEATGQWASLVRTADRQRARPLICGPESDLRNYSRHVDFLMLGRSPLGTSLEMTDYGTWLRQRPRLARLGKRFWSTVQTQPAPSVRSQCRALGFGAASAGAVSVEQIRLLTYTAVAAGSRGLLFQSDSPLDAADADTRGRASALELLNLELTLIEPWLKVGDFVTTVEGSEPGIVGAVLRTDRAHLLLPVWAGPDSQFVPGQSAGNGVSFVVRGIPETNDAYLIVPGALEPLFHKQGAGGMRVTLDEFGLTSLVLLTAEPRVRSSVRRQADVVGRRAAQLQRELAARKLQAVEQVHQQLSTRTAPNPQLAAWLGAARQKIQFSDAALAGGDYPTAYLQAQRAMRPLRLLERAHWEAATRLLPSPVTSPAAVLFATLPCHWSLMERIASAQPGPNAVRGGDFEDLGTMLTAGWQHFQHPAPGVYAEAELASEAAHSGRFGLRLAAQPISKEQPEILVESPPSWITAPAIPVQAGELVSIHGWARVPEPIRGSVDGLLIIDSLSGEPLAERIVQTADWREFTLYRIATEAGNLALTFALSGVGEAWVDDVTVRVVPMVGCLPRRLDMGRLPGSSRP